MMMLLRDDLVIELFDDPCAPPAWIEGVDVESKEYSFCDVNGQMYEGRIIAPGTLLHQPRFRLEAIGSPDLANALDLLGRAAGMEQNGKLENLAALRELILKQSTDG
jgi:hypothetical protein